MTPVRAGWRRLALAVLLAEVAAVVSFTLPTAGPAADSVTPAVSASSFPGGSPAAPSAQALTPPGGQAMAPTPGAPATPSGGLPPTPAGTASGPGPGQPLPPASPSPDPGAPSATPSSPSGPGAGPATTAGPTVTSTPAPGPPASAPPPGPAVPLAGAAGLGFYDGRSSPAGIETAAAWLGSPTSVRYAQDFIDATDWAHISTPWQLPNWKDSPFTMVWGVPMLPCGAPSTQCATRTADYALVASGGADAYFQALARNLVAAGFGSSYIRLGWEFNAGWMGWGICNAQGTGLAPWAGDFVPAYRNIVTSMRSVPGTSFQFIWNPIDSSNASCPGASLESYYPGDSYVDAIALDTYDGIGAPTSTDTARWTDLRDGLNAGGRTAVTPAPVTGQTFKGYGMDWLTAYARAHAKQASLPEWGLNEAGVNGGGGDDASFITQITTWIKANATGPVIFWNYGGGTLPLDIPGYTTGNTPGATAAFKAAFAVP